MMLCDIEVSKEYAATSPSAHKVQTIEGNHIETVYVLAKNKADAEEKVCRTGWFLNSTKSIFEQGDLL